MSDTLDVYACRSCEHAQYSEEKPMMCEKCGGVLTKIEGVHITLTSEETKKFDRESAERQRQNFR